MKERWSLAEKINSYFVKNEIKDFGKLTLSLVKQGDLDGKLGLDTSYEVSYLMTSIAWNISRKQETKMFPDKTSSVQFFANEKQKILEENQENPKMIPLANIIDRAANLITCAYTEIDKKTSQKEIFGRLEPDLTKFRDEIKKIKENL